MKFIIFIQNFKEEQKYFCKDVIECYGIAQNIQNLRKNTNTFENK